MENQGFEEEPRIEDPGYPRLRQSPTQESQTYAIRPARIDIFSSLSNPDGHVYEDILPAVEDVSKTSHPSTRESPRSTSTERVTYEETPVRKDVSVFRRNLTLPFRHGGLDTSTSSSVRVTSREKNVCREDTEANEDALTHEISARSQSIECRPNRRRRKKDCKHCRSKAAASNTPHEMDDREQKDTVLRKNRDNEQQQGQLSTDSPRTILEDYNFGNQGSPKEEFPRKGNNPMTVYTISENVGGDENTGKLIEYERSPGQVIEANNKEDKALIASEKIKAGMRVNSIYSQDRWYAKEGPIFFTDVKEHGSFQRAYSLPVRTQTPSSQNRVNLRRSVRREPPPHPARLHKHRHGWTLHFARPLEASGCTRSVVILLILILALLGIGGVALYIVFEPEKLQMIQQYLKLTKSSSHNDTLSAGMFLSNATGSNQNGTSAAASTTPMSSTLIASILLSNDQSFPQSATPPVSEAETETTSPLNVNSTRYCDDCLHDEVCVALVDEEVPVCRIRLDIEDPTGCAGFCVVNKQKCHRLDVDAFRCVEIEHYCLDDEWTCSNTLCIPLTKRCDGHMNCYDHSDEYNCVCDPETHFQCGNETSCLPLEKRCDGKIDCWDAADEINCTLACPLENEFTCSDGQCISKARFCDGLSDCVDGSDEPHGCQGKCNKQEFTCQNSRCIAKGMKCNGIDDCGDGTDERHCKDRFS
ncbi:uncharacterized protein LOC128878060 isoform X2 [Hylaeus volcanicus]|uniref:uncharacterized protein LOC128878060 isoform X2 n=1 Tax=Hylaeus volcanicus TaxID=313075 RepID=UPI0023B7D132|nr:uncharacterized protein LOC128878060 isoform X2 [Hylaeus volcanicus]